MIRHFRNIFFLFFIIPTIFAYGQADTMQIRDLSEDWRIQTRDGIVPLIDGESFSGNVLFIPVPLKQYRGNLLRLTFDQQVSVFDGEQLISVMTGDNWLSVDSLYDVHGDSVIYTLYKRMINPYEIRTAVYRLADPETAKVIRGDQVIIESKQESSIRNIMVLTMILIMCLAAVMYFYYPRLTRDFFRFSRAVSFRELDENLMKTRPLSLVNILYYVLESFLAAWVLFVLVHYSNMDFELPYFRFSGFSDGLIIWLRLAVVIFGLLILKYMLVRTFKVLFKISGFANNHFYNYIRLGLLFYSTLGIILFIAVFTFHVVDPDFYTTMFFVLAILFLVRSTLIYLKLMSDSSHTILHLFSYLCATELIPLFLVISLGVNQTM